MGWGYIPKNFKNDTNKRLFCRGKLQFAHKKVYQICGLIIIKPKKEKKGAGKTRPQCVLPRHFADVKTSFKRIKFYIF